MSVEYTKITNLTLFQFSLRLYYKSRCSNLIDYLFYIGQNIYYNVVNVEKLFLTILNQVSFFPSIDLKKYKSSFNKYL
jgi:hypothetical protein